MKSAIAIAAHPDDIEFLMSGTLMLLKAHGYQIHYWNLANGCCGSSKYDAATIARIRREEAYAAANAGDRKSTRLNSSHQIISYAVFCLKKKKKENQKKTD